MASRLLQDKKSKASLAELAAEGQTPATQWVGRKRDADLVGLLLCHRWNIVRLLGRGGTSSVYEARHRNGARVAIKVWSTSLSSNERARQRFLAERIANSVEHPAIVRILDDDQAPDGRPFLVMDLLDGETLHARCAAAGGRLAPFEVLRIADRVLDILSATHACGIVHRDIKPSNIFLTVGGGVRILDFGIAAVREELARSAGNELGAVGTPVFMAPEQARWSHGRVDVRSDLWLSARRCTTASRANTCTRALQLLTMRLSLRRRSQLRPSRLRVRK